EVFLLSGPASLDEVVEVAGAALEGLGFLALVVEGDNRRLFFGVKRDVAFGAINKIADRHALQSRRGQPAHFEKEMRIAVVIDGKLRVRSLPIVVVSEASA